MSHCDIYIYETVYHCYYLSNRYMQFSIKVCYAYLAVIVSTSWHLGPHEAHDADISLMSVCLVFAAPTGKLRVVIRSAIVQWPLLAVQIALI